MNRIRFISTLFFLFVFFVNNTLASSSGYIFYGEPIITEEVSIDFDDPENRTLVGADLSTSFSDAKVDLQLNKYSYEPGEKIYLNIDSSRLERDPFLPVGPVSLLQKVSEKTQRYWEIFPKINNIEIPKKSIGIINFTADSIYLDPPDRSYLHSTTDSKYLVHFGNDSGFPRNSFKARYGGWKGLVFLLGNAPVGEGLYEVSLNFEHRKTKYECVVFLCFQSPNMNIPPTTTKNFKIQFKVEKPNEAPNSPSIISTMPNEDGKPTGTTNETYAFELKSSDSNKSDTLIYSVDLNGDDGIDTWYNVSPSRLIQGTSEKSFKFYWSLPGDKSIRIKSIDQNNKESPVSLYSFKIKKESESPSNCNTCGVGLVSPHNPSTSEENMCTTNLQSGQ